jgi:hypothetical protein
MSYMDQKMRAFAIRHKLDRQQEKLLPKVIGGVARAKGLGLSQTMDQLYLKPHEEDFVAEMARHFPSVSR